MNLALSPRRKCQTLCCGHGIFMATDSDKGLDVQKCCECGNRHKIKGDTRARRLVVSLLEFAKSHIPSNLFPDDPRPENSIDCDNCIEGVYVDFPKFEVCAKCGDSTLRPSDGDLHKHCFSLIKMITSNIDPGQLPDDPRNEKPEDFIKVTTASLESMETPPES